MDKPVTPYYKRGGSRGLSLLYLCSTEYSNKIQLNKLSQVVNCFQNCTFVLPNTAATLQGVNTVGVEMSTADTTDNADLDNDVIVRQLAQVDVKGERVLGYDRRVSIEYVVAEEEDRLIDSKVHHYTTSSIPDLLEQINPFFVISQEWSDEADDDDSPKLRFLYKGKKPISSFTGITRGEIIVPKEPGTLYMCFPKM